MREINTFQDLLRLLDEDRELREALRDRLLSRELIDLPVRFAHFAGETHQALERLEVLPGELGRFRTETRQEFGRVNQRLEQLETLPGELGRFRTETRQEFSQVNQRLARLETLPEALERFKAETNARFDQAKVESDARFSRLEAAVEKLQDDIGILRSAHARNVAFRIAGDIAEDMGLWWVRNLDWADLRGMTHAADTSGLTAGEIRSFRKADLVMECTDPAGEVCYIALEISFTVNGRDTSRALRNSRFLTAFTGKSAYAAVTGERLDYRVQEIIDSGAVHYYELTAADMETD